MDAELLAQESDDSPFPLARIRFEPGGVAAAGNRPDIDSLRRTGGDVGGGVPLVGHRPGDDEQEPGVGGGLDRSPQRSRGEALVRRSVSPY